MAFRPCGATNGTMRHMRMTLRPATPDDRPFVEAVYFETQRWIIERLFGWRGEDVERGKFEEAYSEADSEIVILDDKAVGWLSVLRTERGIDVDALYLLPAAQNKGLGTALLRRFMDEARDAGLPLTISTAKINPAVRLYERLGFATTHENEFKVFMKVDAPSGL